MRAQDGRRARAATRTGVQRGGWLARATSRARPGRRLTFVLGLYLLTTALIVVRLADLQVVDAEEHRAAAAQQAVTEIELPSRRGALLDQSGEPLAASVPGAAVYADPRAIASSGLDPTWIAAELAEPLGRGTADLVDDLTSDRAFVYLARQLPRGVGEDVAALGLPWVGVLEEPLREYPAGRTGAQTVGVAGVDGDGLSGLELALDDRLRGEPGLTRGERTQGGLPIASAEHEVTPPVPGDDVRTSLDLPLQAEAEAALDEAVAAADARGAAAVVLDPSDGAVLALAATPGYHPDEVATASPEARRNRPVTDVFEPGSVMKALTVATAIEEGVVAADAAWHVPASVEVGGHRFTDATPTDGAVRDLPEIVATSSNVGLIQLAEELGPDRLHAGLAAFGVGESPGLGFPGEAAGVLPATDAWSATSLPTIAIGQGVSVSLLHTATAFATLAADGERVTPTLLADEAPAPRERVVSPATARAVTDLLVGVVDDGTGVAASIPGYAVAGKTGTAQKPSESARGYEDGAYVATFAGYAPADDPAVVVAVMIDEPQDDVYGGIVAAPVFAEITEAALTRLRVPPDDPHAAARDDRPEAPDPAEAADAPAPAVAGDGTLAEDRPGDEPGDGEP